MISEFPRSWPEYGDDRRADGFGHMKRCRIVRYQQPALGQQGGRSRKIELSRCNERRFVAELRELRAERLVIWASDENDATTG